MFANYKLNKAADNIRIWAAAMVEKAKSGHPGGAMGGADFINLLYTEFMHFDPENPAWFLDKIEIPEGAESAFAPEKFLTNPVTGEAYKLGDKVLSPLTGGQIEVLLGENVFFYGVIQYTNVLLQSHGYAHIPVINTLVCGGMQLVVVYLLVGNPAIGIVGAPVGMLLCYLCIGVMNLIAINRVVPQKSRILQNLLRPVAPAALMGGAVWGVYRILMAVLGAGGSRVLLCGVPVAVGVAVYFVGVVVFKSIRREDCLLLPKGEKIANLLHL